MTIKTPTRDDWEAAGIAFHDGKPAINVKYYGRGITCDCEDDCTPECSEAREYAWETSVEQFWEEATDIAREHGYDYLFGEGRSGGWLVPFLQPTARAQKLHSWPGQGGTYGYPQYPAIESRLDLHRFCAFQTAIEQLLKDVPISLRGAYDDYRLNVATA